MQSNNCRRWIFVGRRNYFCGLLCEVWTECGRFRRIAFTKNTHTHTSDSTKSIETYYARAHAHTHTLGQSGRHRHRHRQGYTINENWKFVGNLLKNLLKVFSPHAFNHRQSKHINHLNNILAKLSATGADNWSRFTFSFQFLSLYFCVCVSEKWIFALLEVWAMRRHFWNWIIFEVSGRGSRVMTQYDCVRACMCALSSYCISVCAVVAAAAVAAAAAHKMLM